MTLLSVLVLMFAYLFLCKIGTNVCVKILGNKILLVLMECLDLFFSEDQQLYQYVVSPKVVLQIL
jgi:hypothetical protein